MIELLISLVNLWLILWLVMVTHEFAHYFAARFYGFPVAVFSAGVGYRFLNFYHQGIRFEFRISPLNGYVKYMTMPKTAPYKIAVVAAAAPATNILLGAAILMIDSGSPLGVLHLTAAAVSSLPVGGNDGAVILYYLKHKKIRIGD